MKFMMPAFAALAGFGLSLVCLRLLLWRFGHVALDRPNDRSLHERPVPRTGGVAILIGALASLAFGALTLWPALLLAVLLAAVSFLDDLYGIPASGRLFAHLSAAGVLIWFVLSPMNPFEIVLLVLAVTWITNLYNFMDGSDGLAGGMTMIGFGAYAVAGYMANDMALAVFCSALCAAAAAFLLYNFHPARIFLGDVGSIPLGFLAGGLGVAGWRSDAWPLWFPLLVFGPFIGDATVTLLRRIARGERVWRAHREHYYQRMVRMGFGHRGTALIGYAAMVMCAVAALLGRGQSLPVQLAAFGAASMVLAMMAVWIDLRWTRFQHESDKKP